MTSAGWRTVLQGGSLAVGMTAAAASAQDISYWTLSFSADTANKALATLEEEFEAAHEGVDLEIVHRGVDDHKSALRIAAGADSGPDVYFSWAGLGLGGEYVMAGMSLPLDDYYAKFGWDDELLPASMAFVDQYEGGRHGVPFSFKGMAIYYNTALFEEAGIESEPATYDELVAAAEKLKEAGIPAFTFGGSVNWHVMRLMDVILEAKCGAETHDALKGMELDWTQEPCATEAFADMQMWAENYFLSPFMGIDQAQSFNLFVAGRAAMMVEGDWLVTQLDDAGVLDNYGLFVAPTGTDRLYGFAEYNYITVNSPNPDIAAEFLDFLISQDFQQQVVGVFGAVSVNKNVEYSDDLPALQKEWLEAFASYDSLYGPGDQAFPLDVTTEYWRIINEVVSNGMAPEQAVTEMQTFIGNTG